MSDRPHLEISRGSLSVGGFEAKDLAEKYGTPLYVTELDRVTRKLKAAEDELSSRHPDVLIAFAYKSNSTPAILKALASRGAGATVVSANGLRLARAAGVRARDIVLDGPSKSEEDLTAAVRMRIGMINAESVQEVLDIEEICAGLKVEGCRVGFRVNFGILADTHAGLATGGRSHKFGVPREEVVEFCESHASELRRVKISGLHSHVGSQISDPSVFRRETEELLALSDELSRSGVEIREFNVGGGLGVDYGEGKEMSLSDYADATAGTFARSASKRRSRLVFELGRWIVADSTVLLTKVNYVKRAGATNWALVDAGMNTFLRPALYGARHRIVAASTKDREESSVVYDIGGPVCETTDTFGSGVSLGVSLSKGDLIAILDTGAYGTAMASTYNMRPFPKTVVVSGGRHRLAPPAT
ncbi:MAG: diaminopimelate decarboxylase [Nitrososphaerota archaeon]|nr:diaminopimelate decarboxylase [Nitrososphaerota archaeon]